MPNNAATHAPAGKITLASLVVVLIAAPFVAQFESVELGPYVDPVGIVTACAGETDREVVSYRDSFTRDECVAVMGASLMLHAQHVDKCITRGFDTPKQAAAVLSWSYNVGAGAACKSTLIRMHNAGKSFCGEFGRWVYGKVRGKTVALNGLIKRRSVETALCEGRL